MLVTRKKCSSISVAGLLSGVAGMLFLTQTATAGLVGYWNFAETSGVVAHDSSGSGINGILTGAASFDPGAGINGGGAVNLFSGGYVNMGDHFAFAGTTPFSVQTWVELAAGDPNIEYPVGRHSSGTSNGYILEVRNGHEAWAFQSGSAVVGTTIGINDGNWHQIVGVYDSGTTSVYVDGVFENSGPRNSITSYGGIDFLGDFQERIYHNAIGNRL